MMRFGRLALLSGSTIGCMSVASALSAAPAAQANGEAVYAKYCGSCHEQVGARIPQRSALEQMSPGRILKTLDFGAMMSIAYPIRRDEREAVARFLGHGADETPPPASAFCKDRSIMSGPARETWQGWSATVENTRYQPAESAGLKAADVPKLQLKWAYGFAGDVTAF